MQEVMGQVFGYIWGIWRYRWFGLIAAWIVAMAGWLFVYQMPDQYEATARINVDSNSVLRPLLRGLAVQPDINQRINLMTRTLLSRPNLEKLIRMADLDLNITNESQKDQMIESLRKRIQLSGERRNPSLYSVSFTHRDRDVAKKVVQSLITVFIESTLGDKREDSADAQVFLDQQIADYENRLKASESRLAVFKQKHLDVLPGSDGGYYQKLSLFREQLSNSKLQLRETQNRRDELRRQLQGQEPVFLSSESSITPEVAQLESRKQSLNSKLDLLLTQYTAKHPEVIQIKNIIADLDAEKSRLTDIALMSAGGDYSGLQTNPVYQQMRSMLAESEAKTAELQVRVNEYEQRVKDLEAKVHNIPEIEAELKQLNRDYEVVQQQHTQLMSRREAARISEDVEQDASDVSFRVIDPPFVPLLPNAPNKGLLNGGVFLASLGLGGGLAFIFSLFHPVVIDKRSLSQVTGLPVLGSVTYIATEKENRTKRMRLFQFLAMLGALLLLFLLIIVGQGWL